MQECVILEIVLNALVRAKSFGETVVLRQIRYRKVSTDKSFFQPGKGGEQFGDATLPNSLRTTKDGDFIDGQIPVIIHISVADWSEMLYFQTFDLN